MAPQTRSLLIVLLCITSCPSQSLDESREESNLEDSREESNLEDSAADTRCSVPCTCFGGYQAIIPFAPQPSTLIELQSVSSVAFFMETQSKVLCSGRLSYLELHVYYFRVLTGSACQWNIDVGLFRKDLETCNISQVEGSSIGPLNGEGLSFMGTEDVNINFNGSGPLVEAGDLVAIQVQIKSGNCVARPFPLSSLGLGTAVPVILTSRLVNNRTTMLSDFSPITNITDFHSENLTFDVSIELEDTFDCIGECSSSVDPTFSPTQQPTAVLLESIGSRAQSTPILPLSTGTSTTQMSTVLLDNMDLSPSGSAIPNTVPDVRIPVYAIPAMVLGPVAVCAILFFLLYLKLRRSMRQKGMKSEASDLAQSLTTPLNTMSIARLGSGSYQQPADAVVIAEVTGHTLSTTPVGNLYTALTDVQSDSVEIEHSYQVPIASTVPPADAVVMTDVGGPFLSTTPVGNLYTALTDGTKETEHRYQAPNIVLQSTREAMSFSDQRANHPYAILEDKRRHSTRKRLSIPTNTRNTDDFDATTSQWQYTHPASREDELLLQLRELSVQEIRLANIQILEAKLGSGEFGVVRRGVWSVGGEEREVAVKSLADGSTEEKRIQFLQEAAIMGQFKHPSIISLYGIITSTESPLIVVELLGKGDLKKHLVSLQSLDGQVMAAPHYAGLLLSFCRQIAAGMAYLQSRDFIHRDLAARNILISHNDICKIADFGLARHLPDNKPYHMSNTAKIPIRWTAPEAIQQCKYTSACDVWSFGVLLWEIWSLGSKPYISLSDIDQVLHKLNTGYRLPPPPGCPSSVYKVMIDCWHPVPWERPCFATVLQSLQCPDFKLLTWTAEDVTAYTEQARTLGAPLEAGEELYTEFQHIYTR